MYCARMTIKEFGLSDAVLDILAHCLSRKSCEIKVCALLEHGLGEDIYLSCTYACLFSICYLINTSVLKSARWEDGCPERPRLGARWSIICLSKYNTIRNQILLLKKV